MNYNIAVFASGSGTNALNLINYFRDHANINIVLIACNKEGAGVLEKAKKENIASFVFNKTEFQDEAFFLDKLKAFDINFIVLAGFLWKTPTYLTNKFKNKMINIHPSLLPKYGGKGMYGDHVHQAVFDNKEIETGITVHYVNDVYDDGKIILQEKLQIKDGETPNEIAKRIHQLEYQYFPIAIEKILL